MLWVTSNCGRTLLGFQNQSQQEIIFGKEVAASNLQSLQNVYAFRQNSRKDAELFSDRLGSYEILETESNVSAGGGHGDKLNLSKRVREVNCVTPSQIQALENNAAFVKLAGLNPTKLEFKYHELPNINRPLDSEMPVKTFLDEVVLIPYVSKNKAVEEAEKVLKNSNNIKNINNKDNKSHEKNPLTEVEKKLVHLVTQIYEAIFFRSDKSEAIKHAKNTVEMFSHLGSIKTNYENKVYSVYFNKNESIYFKYGQIEFSLENPRFSALEENENNTIIQDKFYSNPKNIVDDSLNENKPKEVIEKKESQKQKFI